MTVTNPVYFSLANQQLDSLGSLLAIFIYFYYFV